MYNPFKVLYKYIFCKGNKLKKIKRQFPPNDFDLPTHEEIEKWKKKVK